MLPACSSTPAGEGGTTILSKSHSAGTLVLLPLNVTMVMPEELAAPSPVVYEGIEEYLRSHGASLKTVAFPAARRLWLESIREARTGERGARAGFDDAARIFVGRLARSAEFDAVIIASLFVQGARIEGTKVRWDGREQDLLVERGRRRVRLPADSSIEGVARAASLHAVVLDAAGRKLQEKQAGLALLETARVSDASGPAGEPRYSPVPIDAPFADREQLLDGIARALAPYLSPRLPELAPAP